MVTALSLLTTRGGSCRTRPDGWAASVEVVHRNEGGVLGEGVHVVVGGAGGREDGRITRGDLSPELAVERPADGGAGTVPVSRPPGGRRIRSTPGAAGRRSVCSHLNGRTVRYGLVPRRPQASGQASTSCRAGSAGRGAGARWAR